MRSSLILQEPPLQLLPSLAVAIGLNEAIVVQQLFFLLQNEERGKVLADGNRYIFNTYDGWRKYFPFWSEPTIKRIFSDLEEQSIVVSCQPEGSISRRKYYRLSLGALEHLTYDRLSDHRTKSSDDGIKLIPSGTDQLDLIIGSNRSVPLSETSSETSSEKHTANPPNGSAKEKNEKELPKPRPRNYNLEALVECYAGSLKGIPKSTWSHAQKTLEEISEANPDISPEEIKRRWRNLKLRYPSDCSFSALLKWWAQCAKPPTVVITPNGTKPFVQDRRVAANFEIGPDGRPRPKQPIGKPVEQETFL